jgi:type VII secretion-associated serine protease mycosin
MRARRVAAWIASVVGLATLTVPPAAPARAAPNCAQPGIAFAPVPWPQLMLDFERVWPLTQGANVTVAVIDSGVDATHPQLRGRVAAGLDVLEPATAGRADCEGRGTQTAGIIAAQPEQGVGFHGVAPQATILPVRASDNEAAGRTSGAAGMVAGIRFAVANRARVIVIGYALYASDPALAAEVANAVANDVVVVAAVGEDGAANAPNRTPYPAAYPGVVGVGAILETTSLWAESGRGRFVDLVAPGVEVVSTQRGGGLTLVAGTGLAAAFVGGAAALVRSRWPDLPAQEVVRRLTATAAPAPGGTDTAGYGNGIVSPYAAVADRLAGESPGALPGLAPETGADRERARNWAESATLAVLLAGIGVLVVLACVGVAAALPRGRRARWRPRIAAGPVRRHEDEDPAPPVRLFADREA